jgi:hypothetical protein
MRRRGAANTETHAFLLFAAPVAAIALTVALGWPFWVAGYLAWPLELPAALAIQSSLNRLGEGRRMPSELPASDRDLGGDHHGRSAAARLGRK